jgi:hypothetical protein
MPAYSAAKSQPITGNGYDAFMHRDDHDHRS